jgi:tetratricopeptide (TPR) repeat protein
MILVLDSLKTFDIKISDISLYYAVAHAFNSDYDKAILLLKDSIPSSDKPQLLYHELGNIYLSKGDTVQAIIAYKQAIDCNPNYSRPYLAMAEVYKNKGEKEMAMNNYLAAVRLFAEYEAYEDMATYAAMALKLDSANIELEKFLQYYYYKKGEHRQVVARGLDIDDHCVAQQNWKDLYVNRVTMAVSLFDLKDYENVLYMLKSASEDETTFKEYGYIICCYSSAAYRKLGDDENAELYMKYAKEMDEGAEDYIKSLLAR